MLIRHINRITGSLGFLMLAEDNLYRGIAVIKVGILVFVIRLASLAFKIHPALVG